MVLPAYSFALALIALLGFMAIAAGVKAMPEYAGGFERFGNNFAVPALFLQMFPGWFAGVAFAAIAIGALVPAAIMSIACGNLFTRNIYREFIASRLHARAREPRSPRSSSLVVKLGALFFVLALQKLLCHPAAASGRHLDLPDPARGAARALHALPCIRGRC